MPPAATSRRAPSPAPSPTPTATRSRGRWCSSPVTLRTPPPSPTGRQLHDRRPRAGHLPEGGRFADGFESRLRPVTVDGAEPASTSCCAATGPPPRVAPRSPPSTASTSRPSAAARARRSTCRRAPGGAAPPATDDPVTARDVDPKSIVIALPEAVTITRFAVDPPPPAATPAAPRPLTTDRGRPLGRRPLDGGRLRHLRARRPGRPGRRPGAVTGPRHHLRAVHDGVAAGSGLTGCPDGYRGCTYMDTTELAVYDD